MDVQDYLDVSVTSFNIEVEEIDETSSTCTVRMGTITQNDQVIGYGVQVTDMTPAPIVQTIGYAWGKPTEIISNGNRLALWRLSSPETTDSTWARFRSAFIRLADGQNIALRIEREDFDAYADRLVESPGPSLSPLRPEYQKTLDVLLPPEARPQRKSTIDRAEPTIAEHGITNIRNEEWKRQLPKGPKLLYHRLIGHCGRTNTCMVGQDQLAEDCSADRRSILRWTKYLASEDVGLVTIEPHQYWNMNRYTLPKMSPIDFKASKTYWRDKRKNTRK